MKQLIPPRCSNKRRNYPVDVSRNASIAAFAVVALGSWSNGSAQESCAALMKFGINSELHKSSARFLSTAIGPTAESNHRKGSNASVARNVHGIVPPLVRTTGRDQLFHLLP